MNRQTMKDRNIKQVKTRGGISGRGRVNEEDNRE
jgi:hypothetical protein